MIKCWGKNHFLTVPGLKVFVIWVQWFYGKFTKKSEIYLQYQTHFALTRSIWEVDGDDNVKCLNLKKYLLGIAVGCSPSKNILPKMKVQNCWIESKWERQGFKLERFHATAQSRQLVKHQLIAKFAKIARMTKVFITENQFSSLIA